MDDNAIVRAYVGLMRPRLQAQLEDFRQQPNLHSAIEKAALALDGRSKRYAHQRRIHKAALAKAKGILMANVPAISQCSQFDELFCIVRDLLQPVKGLGELYVYDTSLRLGAFLAILPKKVYLHAGTRVGARALGLGHGLEALPVADLPEVFQTLEPYEIEDALCIFKSKLEARNQDSKADEQMVSRW